MQRPIYIIGVGAIGMTLAVLLRQSGKEVILLRGRQSEHQIAEEAEIILDLANEVRIKATLPVGSLAQFSALNGIVLLTSKSFGNQELAQRLIGKIGESSLVLLQNGLGVEEPFLKAGFPEIYRCVLLATSQVQAPYTVRYKPVAASPIGVIRGDESRLIALVEALSTAEFPFRPDQAIQQTIWEKVITNCVFNAICPLLGLDNGLFYRNSSALALARAIIGECVAVAAKVDVVLDRAEVERRLLQISQHSDGQLISTLVDIQQGRETEIDSLNLAVARLAEQVGQPELATRTKLLGELLRLKSDISRISLAEASL